MQALAQWRREETDCPETRKQETIQEASGKGRKWHSGHDRPTAGEWHYYLVNDTEWGKKQLFSVIGG